MKKIKLFPILLLVLLQACVDLDKIRSFGSNAVDVLTSVKSLDYSFTKMNLKSGMEVNNFSLQLTDFQTNEGELKMYSDADATIAMLTDVLRAYFGGLTKLSDPKDLNTDYSKFGDAVKASNGVLNKLHITEGQIDAATSLASVITNELTLKYREEKIRGIIINADAAVGQVLDGLSTGLQNLEITTDNYKGTLRTSYAKVVGDSTIDKFYRLSMAKEYQSRADDLENTKLAIEAQRQGLAKLKAAHTRIATNLKINKLSSAQVISLIQNYAGDLSTIYSNIKSLIK